MKIIIFILGTFLLYAAVDGKRFLYPVECSITDVDVKNKDSWITVDLKEKYVDIEEKLMKQDPISVKIYGFDGPGKAFGTDTDICSNDPNEKGGSAILIIWKLFNIRESECSIKPQTNEIPDKVDGTIPLSWKAAHDLITIRSIIGYTPVKPWFELVIECKITGGLIREESGIP